MALILHIETATPICSVALSRGHDCIALKELNEFNSHSEVLTVFIEEILDANNLKVKDLDAIALSNGPGSYTGLRIGASVAKGLAYAAEKPIITIDTIEALAHGLIQNSTKYKFKDQVLFCPMIDARRMEVYTAFYNKDFKTIKTLSPFIIDENNLDSYLAQYSIILGGTGAQKCYDLYKHKGNIYLNEQIKCSAKYLIPLALHKYEAEDFANLAYFEPNYLKDFVGK